jgi:hypothetical protein
MYVGLGRVDRIDFAGQGTRLVRRRNPPSQHYATTGIPERLTRNATAVVEIHESGTTRWLRATSAPPKINVRQ